MKNFAFYAFLVFAVLLSVTGAAMNVVVGSQTTADTFQTPSPSVSPTVSPTVSPSATPCFPDDPKKPCPTPEPLPTVSPTMRP